MGASASLQVTEKREIVKLVKSLEKKSNLPWKFTDEEIFKIVQAKVLACQNLRPEQRRVGLEELKYHCFDRIKPLDQSVHENEGHDEKEEENDDVGEMTSSSFSGSRQTHKFARAPLPEVPDEDILNIFASAPIYDDKKQQYYCGYCNQYFPNEKKREFHLKFSDSHTRCMIEWKNKFAIQAEALVTQRLPLYSGSKLFYRQGITYDIDIILHGATSPSCIEVIGYDSKQQKECKRIYLKYDGIQQGVEKEVDREISMSKLNYMLEIQKYEAMKNSNILQNQQSELESELELELELESKPVVEVVIEPPQSLNEEVLRQEAMERLIPAYIMDRILCSTDGALCYEAYQTDNGSNNVLIEPPLEIRTAKYMRHRPTNVVDMQAKLAQLRQSHAALAEQTNKADKLSNLVGDAADVFAQASRLRVEAQKNYSLSKIRWQKAIRHVIAQNMVARTTAHLIDLGLWQEGGDGGGD
jgi:hypothetical protein